MLKSPSEIILNPIYFIKRLLAMVKFLQNKDSEKKSNFIFSDFVLLLVCYLGRVFLHKNSRNICVAICFGSSNNLTGLKCKYFDFYIFIEKKNL